MSALPEAIAAMSSFGQEILTPDPSKAIIEPSVSLKPSDVVSLLKTVKTDSPAAFVVGLLNASKSIVTGCWESFSVDERREVKKCLLSFVCLPLHEKSLPRFSELCASVYRLCSRDWPEYVDVVLHSPASLLSGFLFTRFMSAVDSAFVGSRQSEITKRLFSLLAVPSVSVQSTLILIFSNLDCQAAFQEIPDLFEAIWKSVLRSVIEEPHRIEFLAPLMADIFEDSKDLSERTPQCVAEAIGKVDSVESAKPLLPLLPILCGDSGVLLLKSLLSVSDSMIKSSGELPIEVLNALEDSPIEELRQSFLKQCSEFLISSMKGSQRISALSIFAPLCAQFSEVIEGNAIVSIVSECFHGSALEVSAGLRIFGSLCGFSLNLPFSLPPEFIACAVKSVLSENDFLRKTAFWSLNCAIENELFIDESAFNLFLSEFDSLRSDDRSQFFKCLRRLFRFESTSENFASSVVEFSQNHLKSESSAVGQSELLSLFCAVADYFDFLIEPLYESLLSVAISLMKGDSSESFKYASRLLVVFASICPSESRRQILSLLPRFSSLCDGTSGVSSKIQANIAVSYVTIVICLHVEKEFPHCVSLSKKFVGSNDLHLIEGGSMIAELLRTIKNEEVAVDLFTSLSAAALNSDKREELNALLTAAKKLLKSFSIPIGLAQPLFRSIASGVHPIFGRKPIGLFDDDSTVVFKYLKEYIVRFPESAPECADAIAGCLESTSNTMLPLVLVPLSVLVEQKSLSKSQLSQIGESLSQRLTGADEDIDEASLGLLLGILKNDAASVDVNQLAAKLIGFWEELSNSDPTFWRASVAAAILDLGSNGAEVTDEVIEEILVDFPYDAEYKLTESMSSSIAKISGDCAKWARVLPVFAKAISDFLLLSKEDIQSHEVSKATIGSLKSALKGIIGADKSIERQITKQFAKNRSLLNRFNALLK